jgi:DNA-binding LacI/PurR family transcriptional regulator
LSKSQRVTLKDIASQAGVSKMTVSAVLSGKSTHVFVSESTRQRVLALAHELGYRPNSAAQALVTGRTHVIEFWAQNLSNPFFNTVFHLARQRLLEYNLATTLCEFFLPTPTDPCPSWPADGLLIFDWPVGAGALQNHLQARGCSHLPVVTMGAYYIESADYVGIDLYAGAEQAVRHLVSSGCRRVAYVVDKGSAYAQEVRYRAYTTTVEQTGQAPEYIVIPTASRSSARTALGEYVQARGSPDGLFCHNDLIAMGVYRALCDLGLSVPEDVSLIGCDGIEEVECLERPLSTVVQPAGEMCALACRFLHARLDDPSVPPQQAILQPELVIRQSSRP